MSFLLPLLCKILFATMLTVPPASPLPAPEPTPTVSAQQDSLLLLRKEMMELKLSAKRNSDISSAIILTFFLLLFVAEVIWSRRLAKMQLERYRLFEYSEAMKWRLQEAAEQGEEKEAALAALRAQFVKEHKKQFRQIGQLLELVYLSDRNTNPQQAVYARIKRYAEDIHGDTESHRRFEAMLDRNLDNIMRDFRQEFPGWKEDDYVFMSYVLAGFDATTISVICAMPSIAAVYMRKSRMKKKIAESTSPKKDVFMESMG